MLAQNNPTPNTAVEIENSKISSSTVPLPVNLNKLPLRVMFLNYRIGSSVSAIEKATLHRAMLFKKYFDIDVVFLTMAYSSRKLETLQEYQKTGLVTPKNTILDMFDYFQEITRVSGRVYQEPDLHLEKDYTTQIAANGLDLGVYKNRKQIMYLKYSEDKKLQYVSHSENSKLTRRDEYDEYGFLSRTQIFNGVGKNISNTYYREDGTMALQEFFEIKDEKSVLTSIHIINKQLRYVQTYKSHEELVAIWLEDILTQQDYFNFCLVDRSNFYKNFITRNLQLPNLFIAVQLHSIHHSASDYSNIHSNYNSDYAHCFEDNSTVDTLITLTEQQKNDIILRNPHKVVHSIPHFIEDIESTTTIFRQKNKVIYVARLIEMKEHRQAITAFKEVVKKIPEATLHFYGSGDLKDKLQAQIEELALQHNVFLEGYSSNINEIFASSTASILTSRFEGFSLSILESLNNGCPVVAFDVLYGPSEMVFNGEDGYLVPAGDTKMLAARIIEILENHTLQQSMSIRSKEISGKYFSHAVVAAKWKQVLDLAVGKFELKA